MTSHRLGVGSDPLVTIEKITITANGLPPGVTADPLVLSGKTSQGFLTGRAALGRVARHGPPQWKREVRRSRGDA